MKKKILFLAIILALSLFLLPACKTDAKGSLKSLTAPHIAEYECVEAKYGGEDLLEKYEFIRITLVDKEEMELSYKEKNGQKYSHTAKYEYDADTHELTGDIALLGTNYKGKVKIENGEFTFEKNILRKPLIMKFEMK